MNKRLINRHADSCRQYWRLRNGQRLVDSGMSSAPAPAPESSDDRSSDDSGSSDELRRPRQANPRIPRDPKTVCSDAGRLTRHVGDLAVPVESCVKYRNIAF